MVSVKEIAIVSLNSAPVMSLSLGCISNDVKAGSGDYVGFDFQKSPSTLCMITMQKRPD